MLTISRIFVNQKVLLRESKRHTDRDLLGTPSDVLTGVPPGRVPPPAGYPLPGPGWGVPRYPPAGTPHLDLYRGYLGTPWQGTSLQGTPSAWTWPGTPPLGVDRQMDGWTDTCQNITFRRITYAVGNKNSIIRTSTGIIRSIANW